MATYYTDLEKAYDSTDNGLAQGTAFGGVAGLQKCFATVVAGSIAYIKGEGDMRTYQYFTYNTTAGQFVAGMLLVSNGGPGHPWLATIYQGTLPAHPGGGNMYIEVIAGTPTNTDTFEDDATGLITGTISSVPTKPALHMTRSASYNNLVKYIGVKSDWSLGHGDDYQAILHGHDDTSDDICQMDNCDFSLVENMTFRNSSVDGLVRGTNYTSYCNFRYCRFIDNAGIGGLLGYDYAGARHCTASGNGGVGMQFYRYSNAFACTAYGNGGDGIYFASTGGSVVGCLAYNNGGDGIDVASSSSSAPVIYNCVSDRNGGDGIEGHGQYQHPLIFCNRVTNNTGYGIRVTTTDTYCEDYNVIYNNTAGTIAGLDVKSFGEHSDMAPADDGFVDSVAGDYNLKPAAEISGEGADSVIDMVDQDDAE